MLNHFTCILHIRHRAVRMVIHCLACMVSYCFACSNFEDGSLPMQQLIQVVRFNAVQVSVRAQCLEADVHSTNASSAVPPHEAL